MATETPKIQIGDEIRSMTADEIAALELANAEVENRKNEETNRQMLRNKTLAKLGLTDEEISALFS